MDSYQPGLTVAPGHTNKVFDPNQFPTLVKDLAKRVRTIKKITGANCLAGSGNSGLLLLGALGIKLKMPFFAVRKTKDAKADSRMANGFVPDEGARYLIIDDLISSGNTCRRIHNFIATEFRDGPECVGILLYEAEYYHDKFTFPLEYDTYTQAPTKVLEVPTFFIRSKI